MMRFIATQTVIAGILAFSIGCHSRPIRTGSDLAVGGTIAGVVMATNGTLALAGRKVTAVNVASGARFDTTSSVTGGYTIKVPQGRYRLEVELHEGETLAKRPDETQINNSDLDPGRNFDITVTPPARR
jgi:uncharacterized protein YfaS (alpha-2-macroglobulin family)